MRAKTQHGSRRMKPGFQTEAISHAHQDTFISNQDSHRDHSLNMKLNSDIVTTKRSARPRHFPASTIKTYNQQLRFTHLGALNHEAMERIKI